MNKFIYIKNTLLNNKITKTLNNRLLMDKIDKNVKNLFVETSKDILKKAKLKENELKPIIKRIDNLIYTEKSNNYYLNEASNTFFYNYKDLRIHVLNYRKRYKNEIDELKRDFIFDCGKAIEWIGLKPPLKGCEFLRPLLCETIMDNIDPNKLQQFNENKKVIKTIEIISEIIEKNDIKDCILKKTLEYDKRLIKNLKQK